MDTGRGAGPLEPERHMHTRKGDRQSESKVPHRLLTRHAWNLKRQVNGILVSDIARCVICAATNSRHQTVAPGMGNSGQLENRANHPARTEIPEADMDTDLHRKQEARKTAGSPPNLVEAGMIHPI
jgi:hypothetical protein